MPPGTIHRNSDESVLVFHQRSRIVEIRLNVREVETFADIFADIPHLPFDFRSAILGLVILSEVVT
jgi:hypothetical protein